MKTYLNTLARGPQVMRAPEDDQGAEADKSEDKAAEKAAETIDPAKYQGLATAHERLKKDSAADRAALNELKERLAAFEAKEAEAAEAKAREAGDFDTVKKQLETRHQRDIETRDGTITKQRAQIEKLVVDAGLAQAIIAANVKPEFVPAVTALLRQGVEIGDDGDGNPVASRSGIPLAEAVRLWAETDGKAFIANGNTGGDAKGGGGSGGSKTMTQAEFDALDPKTRAERMTGGWSIKP